MWHRIGEYNGKSRRLIQRCCHHRKRRKMWLHAQTRREVTTQGGGHKVKETCNAVWPCCVATSQLAALSADVATSWLSECRDSDFATPRIPPCSIANPTLQHHISSLTTSSSWPCNVAIPSCIIGGYPCNNVFIIDHPCNSLGDQTLPLQHRQPPFPCSNTRLLLAAWER